MRRTMRAIVAGVAAAVVTVSITAVAPAAMAQPPENPNAPLPAMASNLPSKNSPTWQTNDAVYALAAANGVVYAGGYFTKARPPGTSTGDPAEVSRPHLMAYTASTGNILPLSLSINSNVLALALSPDKKTLYVGGGFTAINSVTHNRIAAIDTATGTLKSWAPIVGNGVVKAIAATDTGVYVGGTFTSAGGQTRNEVASFDPSTGALQSWAPKVDGIVNALLVSPAKDSSGNPWIVLGGGFRVVNSVHHSGIAQVDQTAGTVNGPMSDGIIEYCASPCTTHSDVKALATDGKLIFIGAEGTGAGWFDGQAAADPVSGNEIWENDCKGATQAVMPVNGALYVGSHTHDCSAMPSDGFPQYPFQSGYLSWHHLLAMQAEPDSAVPNSGGQLLNWYPVVNPGPTNGSTADELGPRAMATDGTNLYVAGQFTTVNGQPQQGLTRFMAGPDVSPPTMPSRFTATATSAGAVTLRWAGTSDPDTGNLTYTVRADSLTSAPLYTSGSVASHWWYTPNYSFSTSGLSAGTHTFYLSVSDGTNTTTKTVSVSLAAAAATYQASVVSGAPSWFWPLSDASGTTAADSSGSGVTGTYTGTYARNTPGAITGTTGVSQPTTGATIYPNTAIASAPPAAYSMELWFRTTTQGGGRLIGWSNAKTGTSANPDRTVYMTNTGQVIFAVKTGNTCSPGNVYAATNYCYVWSKQQFNDGTWHHLVATQDSNASGANPGIVLYIDSAKVGYNASVTGGQQVAGIFRVGSDSIGAAPRKPANAEMNGDLADVAVYPYALATATVVAHAAADAPGAATAPLAPSNVTATPGDSSANVSWSAPATNGGSAITKYTVTPFKNGVAQTAVDVAATAMSTTISGLTNGTPYTFSVTATNAVGTSPASAQSAAVTPMAIATAPDAPSAVTAAAGVGSANVSWTPPASNGGSAVTSYVVTPYDGSTAQTPTTVNNGGATSTTVTGLTPGTAYTFTVAATNAVGTGTASNPSNAVKPTAPALPAAPTNVGATAGVGSADVSWIAPTNTGGSGLTGFVVTPYLNGTTAQTPVTVNDGNATQTTVTGLTGGSSYTFTVAAMTANGTGAASDPSPAVTPTGTPPGQTTGVAAVPGDTISTVSWTPPVAGDAPITSYTVQPLVAGSPSGPAFVESKPSATKALLTNLTNGTAYTFTVTANSSVGSGPTSAASSAVTPAAPLSFEESAPEVKLGDWGYAYSDAAIAGNGYRISNTVGGSAQLKFTGSTWIWYAMTGPSGGQAAVTIDTTNLGTVDLYAPTPALKAFTYTGLGTGAARVGKITVLNTHNAASTGFDVSVDAFKIDSTTYDDNNYLFNYTGWRGNTTTSASGGALRLHGSNKAIVTIPFVGSSITWITELGTVYGKANVYIDGVQVGGTIDNYSATQQWKFARVISAGSSGPHTLVIMVLGQHNTSSSANDVAVDAFTVTP